MLHRSVTTNQGAEILEVPARVISQWRHRGRVMPVGMLHGQGRGGQVPLYRLADLQHLADSYHARVRSA